jgi:exonuclease III
MIMDNMLKIMTFNAKGLKGPEKRNRVFQWLNNKDMDIIMIQESHFEEVDRLKWKESWKGEIYSSIGRGNSRGVSTLISEKANYKVLKEHGDREGRWLILLVEINKCVYCVINYYGPNRDDITHLKNMLKKTEQLKYDHLILSGDLNFVFNIKLDKQGGTNKTNEKCRNTMMTWQKRHNIEDIWRTLHPNKKQYTWTSNSKPRIQCRLDHILISEQLVRLTKNSTIIPGYNSDHNAVTLELEIKNIQQRGRGYWKFNSMHLGDKELDNRIKSTIETTVAENPDCSKRLMWDLLKCTMRRECIAFSCKKKRERHQHERNLEEALSKAMETRSKLIESKQDLDNIEDEISTIQEEINQSIEVQCRGAALRSQCQNYELGERATKFFMNQEKQAGEKKTINILYKEDGSLTTNQDDILVEEYKFYKNLYKNHDTPHEGEDREEWKNLFKMESPKVAEEEWESLISPITEEEIHKIVKNSPQDKSPGNDGFTNEYYKYYWNELKPHLIAAYNEALTSGELCISQKRGVISLLPKEGKDPRHVKNWRPITLLNSDYKYLSKCLSDRCRDILPTIIGKDQNGFIKGRQIGSNIIRLLDMIESCKEEDLKGVTVNIDIEKAFDSISWNFMYKALEFFNFPPKFIKWIKCLYIGGEVCTMNNGHTSNFIQLGRGVRQGCPMSPPLFVIAIELLSLYIQNSKDIQGIDIYNSKHTISQFADDTSFFLKTNKENIENLFRKLKIFGRLSGLNINVSKTEILLLGSSNISDIPSEYQNLVKKEVKVLGCQISVDINQTIKTNYEESYNKMIKTMEFWEKKPLSLMGKINMLKCCIIPKLLYCMTVLPSPDNEFWKRVQRKIHLYLAGGNQEQLKRSTLKNSYKNGGAQMIDVEVQNLAIKCMWILKAGQNPGPWTFRINKLLGMTVEDFITCNIAWDDIRNKKLEKSMWKEPVEKWCKENFTSKMKDQHEIAAQKLWGNSNIKVGGKTLHNQRWADEGIELVWDILDGERKRLLTYREFTNIYQVQANFLEYGSIKKAIPGSWKNMLRSGIEKASLTQAPDNILDKCTKNGKGVRILYNRIVQEKVTKPLAKMEQWLRDTGSDEKPEDLIRNMETTRRSSKYTKIQSYNYNYYNRNLSYGARLQKMGLAPTNECELCHEKETILHLYWDCPDTKKIWTNIYSTIQNSLGIHLSKELCLLGVTNTDLEKTHKNMILLINTICRYYIHRMKCRGQKRTIDGARRSIKRVIDIELYINRDNITTKKHRKDWNQLSFI